MASTAWIDVYIRIRPTINPSQCFALNSNNNPTVTITVPKSEEHGYVNNSKVVHSFQFTGAFDIDCPQERLFNVVAAPVINNVLNGINGTIFAYGQTGSGKTFTITGGPERYADRGIIPRSLAYIFKERQSHPEINLNVLISYLEIYQEKAFDLLSSAEGVATKINDLNKVTIREDELGNMHFHNLSMNSVSTEEEALNLLFLGDTNRIIAETPINDASSRSHCIFMIWVERRVPGEEIIRKAKLHLVDLAGSERPSKTGLNSDERLFKESRSINLALHYLEQVIIALHVYEKDKKTHIPYRNSLITTVLRDSLGGNCKTTMLGTVAIENACIEETISTCRFAQSVAQVRNTPRVNEELDPYIVIQRLQKEVAYLREEILLLKRQNGDVEDAESMEKVGVPAKLLPEEQCICDTRIEEYLNDSSNSELTCDGELRKFRYCFHSMRSRYWQIKECSEQLKNQCEKLQVEYNTLNSQINALSDAKMTKLNKSVQVNQDACINLNQPEDVKAANCAPQVWEEVHKGNANDLKTSDNEQSIKAYSIFCRSVQRSQAFAENKTILFELHKEAKGLGEKANTVRRKIVDLKMQLEKLRVQKAVIPQSQHQVEFDGVNQDMDEEFCLKELMMQKTIYRKHMSSLSEVEKHIERIQQLTKQSTKRLQHDFDKWYATLTPEKKLALEGTLWKQQNTYEEHQAGSGSVNERMEIESNDCTISGCGDIIRLKNSSKAEASVSDLPIPFKMPYASPDLKPKNSSSAGKYSQLVKAVFVPAAAVENTNVISSVTKRHLRKDKQTVGSNATDDINAFYKTRDTILNSK